MQAEHAHLDMNYGIHEEPRLTSDAHIKEVAHAAMKHIPGATQLINATFNKGKWQKPFSLPGKRHINQAMHLGWG